MIDDKILDNILPVPDRDELKESIQNELMEQGFAITNFSSGGIFYTLMMILIQIRIELVKLIRMVVNNMFIAHAEDAWLELKAGDFSKKRKQPIKTRGYVTLKRQTGDSVVKMLKGDVFKTDQDINGDELRYLVLEDTLMQKSVLQQKVLVEAEKEGSIYNVPSGQIRKSLTHLPGIDEITNEADWIDREGSDLESIESLRGRTLNSWAELSTFPIRDKYKNIAEAVDGVLFVRVDDLHPRGQGTIDIIVTSTAGAASETLLNQVSAEVEKIRGPYDNLLVKSSETVAQDIELILQIPNDVSDVGLLERASSIIINMFKITKDRDLNELYQADIIFALRKEITTLKNVRVILPDDDVVLESDKVIILGTVSITIQRG